MKGKYFVLINSVVAALGGFLFGFDTAVISGAEQAIQQLWSLDDVDHGLVVAIALYGTVVGALFGGYPADRLGRKRTLFWVGVFYLISAVGSALAPDVETFMILRFLGGLGVGASSVAAPMYISEISPANSRGRMVALFQFNVVFGILIAYVSNYFMEGVGGADDWRWMLGLEALPALVFMILINFVPRSPRWLIVKKGKIEEAKAVLISIDAENAEATLKSIQQSAEHQNGVKKRLFAKKYTFPILLAFLFAFFNQVSGINAIIYYAPRLFEMTGLAASSALLSTAGIGLVNMIFTILGMVLIDKVGRKILMYIGSLGLIIALGLVSNAFYTHTFGGVPTFLLIYIGFFALSQGAVIWVFISEIFPNEVRAAGQSLGSFSHWLMAAFIANVFPFFTNVYGGGPIFLFFTVMMIFQLLFVWQVMPETKGKTLEQIQKDLSID